MRSPVTSRSNDVRAGEKILQLVIQAEGFEAPTSERNRLSDADRQIVELLLGQSEAESNGSDAGHGGSA